MDVAELDRLIDRWKRDLDNITHNVLELTELVTYQMLSNAVAAGQTFSGRSTHQVPEAVEAVGELVQQLRLLREVVDEAVAERESLPRFMQARAIAAIRDKLMGPSIVLRTDEVPLDQRGLLSSAEHEKRVRPEELKSMMVRSFERAKPVLLEVEETYERVGLQISELRTEGERIRDTLAQHGRQPTRALELLMSKVEELDRALREDPLGFDHDVGEYLESYVKAARKALKELDTEKERLATDIQAAMDKIDKLRSVLSDCQRLRAMDPGAAAAASRVAEADRPAEPDDIDAELRTLVGQIGSVGLATLREGLDAWQRSFGHALASARAEQARLKSQLSEREELLRRWQAAREKLAQHNHGKIAEDKALRKFSERIDQLIRERAPVDEADRMIYAFETRLDELIIATERA